MITILKNQKISPDDLRALADAHFETMVKYVVDVERGIIAAGGELHADAEKLLLESGSRQNDLWGANLHIYKGSDERHEYTSLINIRPAQNNFSMEIEDEDIRQKIKNIVEKLLLDSEDSIS